MSANPRPISEAFGPGNTQNIAAPIASSPRPAASERRLHTRREVLDQRLISIELGAHNGGLVLDLSTGGAAVVAVSPIERNSSSPFSFQIADSDSPIEGTGTFVWVDNTGLNGGLRFERLSPSSKKLIDQWLREPASTPPQEPSTEEVSAQNPSQQLESSLQAPSETKIDPELEAKLTRLAERARLVALANGACIALKEEDGFRCQASVGTAPDVGLRLSQERSLAAECIAGKHLVVCNDAARDPRVNAATRERLNLASAILLPLLLEGDMVGVLGAFSDRRDAFGDLSIARLQDVARQIESSLTGTARAAVKPAIQPSNGNERPASPPGNPPAKRATSGDAISIARIFTVSLIATVALLGGLYLYQLRARSSAGPVKISPPRASSTSQPPAPQRVATANPSAPSATLTTDAVNPAISQSRPPTKPVADRSTQPAAVELHAAIETSHPAAFNAEAPPPRAAAAKQELPSAQKADPSAVTPAPAPSPQKTVVATDQVPSEVPITSAPIAVSKAPPLIPHVQILTDILRPKPGAGGSSTVPELLSKSSISYPQEAIAAQRQGSVILKVTVAPAGTVRNVELLDGDSALSAEAVRTVRQWRYQPYKAAGHEVEVELLLTVNFVLSH